MAVKGSKRILALKKRKAREQEGAFLIEGIRLCEEALKVDGATEQLIFARDMLDRNERLATLHQTAEADADVMVQMTDRRAMKGMCDTETPQGVVGVAREPEWELLNAKVVRSTMGSVFRLPVLIDQRPGSLCDDLKRAGVHIFATDVDGRLFTEVDYSKPHAFLLGNEAFGIDPEVVKLADQTVGIPMAEPVNSLNVGVAAGVLLYQGMSSRL